MDGVERTQEETLVSPSKPKKKRGKMLPAPIEKMTKFNIAEYLAALPSGLTVGQASHSIPKYRAGLRRAMQRTREKLDQEKEANFADSDEENVTAAKCVLRINGKAITAIVDSGAATSIMTKPLMKRLGYAPNRTSNVVVVTANGDRTRSLGIIDNVVISFRSELRVRASFQALESKDEVLILGNDWLRDANAVMNWANKTLTVRIPTKTVSILVTFTRTLQLRQERPEEEISSEDEYEIEDLIESSLYYSDISYSSDEGDLAFNPWVDTISPEYESESELEEELQDHNPATFLAEAQVYTAEEIKPLINEPLEFSQQKQLDDLLSEYKEICAKNQTEIGRTTEIKHQIFTGNATPVAQ